MWSDPIDELIRWAEGILENDALERQNGRPDANAARIVRNAKRHRELENRTGKVGFEATNG